MHTSQQEVSTSKLFSNDVQYQIPRYQRRYVWNETNWHTLSTDILALLGLELEGDKTSGFTFNSLERHQDSSTEKDKKHFTGIIVTRQIDYGELEIFEVIDGQQRLTTFQIILCVIRDIFESQDPNGQARQLEKFIENDPDAVNRSGEDTTYKICPTEFDSKEFGNITNREFGRAISSACDEESYRLPAKLLTNINNKFTNGDSHKILDAYYYFHTLTMDFIHRDGYKRWKYELDRLFVAIKSQLRVLLTTLDESDHSEKIFESINATGRKLAEFDYLRNNLFLRTRQLDVSLVEEFYKKYWHFENTLSYWDAETLESFLRVFLKAKLGPSCFESSEENGKDRKAFEAYQQEYNSKVKEKAIIGNFDEYDTEYDTEYNQIKYEFHELDRYSKTYRVTDPDLKARIKEGNSRTKLYEEAWHGVRRRMEFYNDLKMKNFLPFILHLRWEGKKSINELEMILKILESYIMRRLVSTGNMDIEEDIEACNAINKFFGNIIKGAEFKIREFVDVLPNWPTDRILLDNEIDPNSRMLIQKASALQKIANSTDNHNHSPNTVKRSWSLINYILYRIEEYLRMENSVSYEFSFDDFLSSYVPTRIGSENDLERQMPYWLSIGNLTFRKEDKEVNSTVDFLPFNETREILLTPPNSNLELNKKVCRANNWNLPQQNIYYGELRRCFLGIWPNQKSLINEVSRKNFKPDETLTKTYIGELIFWGETGTIVECSDFTKHIRVEPDDFKDTDDKPIRIGQKVRFELGHSKRDGRFLKGINMVLIED